VEGLKGTGSHWRRAALIVGVILGGVIVARAFGFTAYLRFENLSRLTETIEGYGVLGPVIYIAAYVLGVVFFVPGLPMTLLGGLAFGPVRGAAYVWIAATIGAALAFLVARYGLRGLVEGWVARNARLTRMDEAVARDGWRIVMITRLVPLFPFNLQNYAYGVTQIGFWAYLTTSAVCMIPATVAYTFAGGALSRGGGELRRTVGYLAVAGVLIVLVSLIPRYLERRNRAAGALLRMAILLSVLAALQAAPEPVHAGAAYATLPLCQDAVSGINHQHLVDHDDAPAYVPAALGPSATVQTNAGQTRGHGFLERQWIGPVQPRCVSDMFVKDTGAE
jgi:uncharacterized membrane protein YdjX (TVP38/TMEM64 family)